MSQHTATVVGLSRIERRVLLDEASHAGWAAYIEADEERYFGATPTEAVETLCRLRTGVAQGIDWKVVQALQDETIKQEIEQT